NTDDGWLLDAGDAYFDGTRDQTPRTQMRTHPRAVPNDGDDRTRQASRQSGPVARTARRPPGGRNLLRPQPVRVPRSRREIRWHPAGDLANPPPGERGAAVTPMDDKNTTALIPGASSGLGGPAAAV